MKKSNRYSIQLNYTYLICKAKVAKILSVCVYYLSWSQKIGQVFKVYLAG